MASGFTPLGSEFQVNSYTNWWQYDPAVTGLSGGGYVVTWTSLNQDGTTSSVYGQRYDAGGSTVGAEVHINTYPTSDQWNSAVTGLSDGGFVVTWQSSGQDGSNNGIFGQRYNASGTAVGAEFQVNTYTPSDQQDPAVTGLSDGGFVVTWQSDVPSRGIGTGIGIGVYGQRYNSSGTAVGSEFHINTFTTNVQGTPSITDLSDGGFVVTWHSKGQDGDGWGIYGQHYNASGTAVGAEFQINTYTPSDQQDPAVTGLSDGGFVVTWHSYGQDGSVNGVYGQRYNASGASVGAEFQVNTYTTSAQDLSSVTALSDGGFVVTWTSTNQDGDGLGIYGQRYDASGATVGAEFQINTYTTSHQWSSDVTSLSDGGFVVAWQSDGQDGSSKGVFGQQFAAELWGTSGNDTIVDAVGANWINGRAGNDKLKGGGGGDKLFGGNGADRLFGENGSDRLHGGNQADRLWGGNGDDKLWGDAGKDKLWGDAGKDKLWGDAGKDKLWGDAGNDKLWGDAGNDKLWGGNGADTLDGGHGNDRLTGGTQADMFVFKGANIGADRITDFVDNVDTLKLDNALWGNAPLSIGAVISTYASIVGADVVFDFGAGNTVTLEGFGATGTAALANDIVLI